MRLPRVVVVLVALAGSMLYAGIARAGDDPDVGFAAVKVVRVGSESRGQFLDAGDGPSRNVIVRRRGERVRFRVFVRNAQRAVGVRNIIVKATFERLENLGSRAVHRRERVIGRISPGQRKAVRFGLGGRFRFGELYRLTLVIEPLVGETVVDNNVRTYRMAFARS